MPLDAIYRLPYRHLSDRGLGNVLIVGAGTGNDVAVALAQGARHVDAVEIDPVLHRTGVERHPDHPYQDLRVTSHIQDGRAFLERSHDRYDLILFALPDSLTLVAGQSSLRLESYLFTEESIQQAKDHLEPGGVFSMYNYYRPLVFDRFAGTLHAVFGRAPCVDFGSAQGSRRQAVLTDSADPAAVTCDASATWHPPAEGAPAPASDDHPFPYLRERTIPLFYVIALLLILLGSAITVRAASGPFTAMRGYVDLSFMGAAFLLLETKNVVQFALLFGTTWFVNALVFAGILVAVLAAVEVARRSRLPRPSVLYAALFAALLIAWAVPPSSLLGLASIPRFAAATALAFAPVFLANLVFAQRFREVASSSVAFGANLLGAMAGGVLEYLALVAGYRFLLVVVAALYGLAFAAGRRVVARST
jgi:SAM-dependent methyltransferase